MTIKTHAERFADNRADRRAHCGRNASARRSLRAIHKAQSKIHSKLFKAVREDKRFAAPALYNALARSGHAGYFGNYIGQLKAALGVNRFSCDIPISPDVYFLTAAHQSKIDELKIACYPTRRDAARGREVVLTPGRFFRGVYANESDAFIQAKTEEYIAAFRPVVIHYADDADTWADVYSGNTNIRSCMSKFRADAWDHPARFYVYPENGLRLAYITDGDGPEDTAVARAIVNIDRMAYVRVYGDARIASALESAGFEEDAHKALEGVRCAARTNDNGQLIAPYIDGPGALDWDGGDYCTINKYGSLDATTQSGYIGHENYCDDCGEGYDEGDGAYSEHHEVSICDNCAQRNYTYAYVTSGRYPERDLIRDDNVVYVNGENYLDDPEVLAAAGFVQVRDGDWADMDDCIFMDYLYEYLHRDDYRVTRLDIPNEYGDEYMLAEDTQTVTIAGEEKIVSRDYDGITDDDLKAIARKARRMIKARGYSRPPQRGNGRNMRGHKRAALFARMTGEA